MAWHQKLLQAIIWISDGIVYGRIYASLDLDELSNTEDMHAKIELFKTSCSKVLQGALISPLLFVLSGININGTVRHSYRLFIFTWCV